MKHWFHKLVFIAGFVIVTFQVNAQPSLTPYNVVYETQSKNQLDQCPWAMGI